MKLVISSQRKRPLEVTLYSQLYWLGIMPTGFVVPGTSVICLLPISQMERPIFLSEVFCTREEAIEAWNNGFEISPGNDQLALVKELALVLEGELAIVS